MHQLARQVRFQIDPFGRDEYSGWNSYAGKPVTGGVGLYFALWVHLRSKLNPDTGFVVNVSEIDAAVREWAIPLFQQKFNKWFSQKQTPLMLELYNLLRQTRLQLKKALGDKGMLYILELELSPSRKTGIQWGKQEMLTYTEKFEFAAMHKLWNEKFDAKENFRLFGKCANPTGHGHNYIVEVTVCPPVKKEAWIEDFERTVRDLFVEVVDHKNLNIDISVFKKINPTVENIAEFAWKQLYGKLKPCKLVEITVWENDRTYCKYSK